MENTDIKEIKITKEDGTERIITKGFFCEIKPVENEEATNLTFNMVGISGQEISTIIYGVTELGIKMGLFDNKEDK